MGLVPTGLQIGLRHLAAHIESLDMGGRRLVDLVDRRFYRFGGDLRWVDGSRQVCSLQLEVAMLLCIQRQVEEFLHAH